MTDSMKFGPEWLRNLSQENASTASGGNSTGNNNSGGLSSVPRYQLAEFRYGREEMLALFDSNILPPDPLKKIHPLFVEKTQSPLALIPTTEEETRMWNRGINSDVVLRLTGKGGQGSGGPPLGGPGGLRGGLGSRGGSMDRGRGRGRGGSFHYSRGISYDETEGNSGMPSSNYSRNVRSSYDRERMHGGSNSWTERNGGDADSSSPRKEFGGSNREMNWRRQDDEGWRSTRHDKWVRGGGSGGGGGGGGGERGGNSWRDGDGWEGGHRTEGSRRSWDEPSNRKPWDSEDNLPEWATENPSESGGTFDASGAFHGGGVNSDEEEEHQQQQQQVNGRGSKQLDRREKESSTRGGGECTTNHRPPSQPPDTSASERISISNGPTSQLDRLDVQTNPKKHSRDKGGRDDDGPPAALRQSQSASSLATSLPPARKSSAPSQHEHHPHRLTTSTSLAGVNVPASDLMPEQGQKPNRLSSSSSTHTVMETAPRPRQSHTTQPQSQPHHHHHKQQQQQHPPPQSHTQPPPPPPQVHPQLPAKNEDLTEPEAMQRMQEAVAKLIEGEETGPPASAPLSNAPPPQQPPAGPATDRWFYRDPQGEVQGPFNSAEMGDWYRSGYFSLNLLVRRACDERYVPLGELMKVWGKIPFLGSAQTVPPPKMAEPPQVHPQPQQTLPPPSAPLRLDETLLLQQIQYKELLLRQQALTAKLSQTEHWNSLSPEHQMLMRASLEMNAFQQPPVITPPVPAQLPSVAGTDYTVAALIQKLAVQQQQAQQQQAQQQQAQQQQAQQQQHQHQQQVGGDPLLAGAAVAGGASRPVAQSMASKTAEEDQRGMEPILSLMRQLQGCGMQPGKMDSVWGGPNPTAAQQQQHLSNWAAMSPMWGSSDVHPKTMKTEQDILEEVRKAEEERKKEEQRKQEELKKIEELKAAAAAAEEERKRKKREEEEVERKRKEEEEAERKRKKEEEDARKKEVAAKKAEMERIRKEEEKRRKEEEKRRKEEEKKKAEEEKKRLEEEKRKREEEARRAEQARKQAEALKRLQEQAKVTPPWGPPSAPSTNLSEILKIERKQQQLLREQQQQQQLQQAQLEAQRMQQSQKMQLKWAEQKPPSRVKSLAEIQAEEQENLVAKQVEKERSAVGVSTSGVSTMWSGQNLTWNNNPASVWGTSNCVSSAGSGNSNQGFWEEVQAPAVQATKAPPVKAAAAKPPSTTTTTSSATSASAVAAQAAKSGAGKTKTKKEELVVMKLFEQSQPKADEFFLWCSKALSAMQSDVDIPTFVTFLRDIESEYDVRDYVKVYLGESKDAGEFATQFLERRIRMANRQNRVDNNNQNAPSPASHAYTTANHFQEVKGKNKKPKKNKMLRVDNRILGFNVTAAHDRINVGDRDYGEGT